MKVLLIEDAASGQALIQVLKHEGKVLRPLAITPKGDKESWNTKTTALINSGLKFPLARGATPSAVGKSGPGQAVAGDVTEALTAGRQARSIETQLAPCLLVSGVAVAGLIPEQVV